MMKGNSLFSRLNNEFNKANLNSFSNLIEMNKVMTTIRLDTGRVPNREGSIVCGKSICGGGDEVKF